MNALVDEEVVGDTGQAKVSLSVLLPTDGSAHALEAAHLLARVLPPGTNVELLTVLSLRLTSWTYLGELSDAAAGEAAIEEATALATGRTRELLEAAGHLVTVRRRFGHPPDEALAEIEATSPDLVVVGRRGLGRAASPVLGSVSESLVRHATVPVLVVPWCLTSGR